MSELQGKIAFVTGAGRGVGAAISLKLAQLGATVAVTDANAATAEEVSSAITSAGYRRRPTIMT
jgi:NAD(P)-dependent dehydrogenase (short-subunit alcohol dehydrogenase family)